VPGDLVLVHAGTAITLIEGTLLDDTLLGDTLLDDTVRS
jgi:hydrogenase maturation factor